MKAWLLAASLVAPPSLAVEPATKETVSMVEKVLKTPTEELPPGVVPPFLAVDPESLPKKLRQRFLAKRVELYSLKHLADTKKRGAVRMPDYSPAPAVPDEGQSDNPGILLMAGYTELTESELDYVKDKSKCTERDLETEFSLKITVTRDPKTRKVVGRRLFLHAKDPLQGMVAAFRSQSGVGGQTNFFGVGGFTCAH